MGLATSKRLPVAKVSSKMLSSDERKSILKTKIQILTPDLCSRLLRKSSKSKVKFCSIAEIDFIRKILLSRSNFLNVDAKDFRQKVKARRNFETEIIALLRQKTETDKNILSINARNHLKLILNNSKSDLRWNFGSNKNLFVNVVLSQLENISAATSSSGLNWLRAFPELVRSVLLLKLDAKDLRKNPRQISSGDGLDRAHTLSLFLAVRLWKEVFGHTYISVRHRRVLRDVLSTGSNVVVTCKFANRLPHPRIITVENAAWSLHVKYDNEIADALASKISTTMTNKVEISAGAKMRVRHILKTLPRLKSESKVLKNFWDQSYKLLKPLSE